MKLLKRTESYRMDTKGSSKSEIQEGLTTIASSHINEAMASYTG